MDPRKKSTTQKQSSSTQLTKVYLLIYNSILTIGLVQKYFIYTKFVFLLFIVGHLFYMKQSNEYFRIIN
jgi:hypothetical protein